MRIFITFILPEQLVAKHELSFAAVNFSRNLISGGGFDKAFSLIPTSVSRSLGKIEESGYEVIYSSLREKNRLLSKLAIFYEQWRVFRKINCGDSAWFYNINMLNGFLFILLRLFKPSVKLNIIVLDFTPANSWHEPNWFFLKLINRADGIITLSPSTLFTCRNSICLPGVVPNNTSDHTRIEEVTNDFLISGTLRENISMLRGLLIPAFKQMSNCRLHISGITENKSALLEEIKYSPNIIYHGKISSNEYINLLETIPFLISSRDPSYPENQCNFPSKIIEALLHNRIVISTIDYPQLGDIKYLKVSADIEKFVKEIQLALSSDSLSLYANQSDTVKNMFSTIVWNHAMEKIESNHR